MVIFLASYILFYGGLNAYALLRFGQGLSFRLQHWIAASMCVAFLVFLPIMMHAFSEVLGDNGTRWAAWIAWVWMAWSFWFASSSLVVDVWNIGENTVYQCHRFAAKESTPPVRRSYRISKRRNVVLGATLVFIASAWGLVEAGRIRVREIRVASPKISANTQPIRIMHLSDLHIGNTMRDSVIRSIVRLVKQHDPDILVSTGDLIDAHGERVEKVLRSFADIAPSHGKFAVIGNHEYYPGVEESIRLHECAGFRVLRGESVSPLPWLRIAGVDCPGDAAGTDLPALTDEGTILDPQPSPAYTILLKHYPVLKQTVREQIDLQLSGHVHGGQIFPFGLFTRLAYRLPAGKLVFGSNGGAIYVSRGAGTWGPPFRVFCSPEIPLFILEGS